MEIRCKINQ
uniref:Uncharacterized protein n=1 Tax=Anguilla anguilla TaxID=7936 RepID=A0A0E9V7T0_ANGAN